MKVLAHALCILVMGRRSFVVSTFSLSTSSESLIFSVFTAHTHFRNGLLVLGNMVPFSCPVKKIVYTSKDPNVKKVVVIFRGQHSHPPWPEEKPNQDAKDDLKKCVDGLGILGVTGGQVENGLCYRLGIILGS